MVTFLPAQCRNTYLAPDGTYVDTQPQPVPGGSYVDGKPHLAPDGSYVGTFE